MSKQSNPEAAEVANLDAELSGTPVESAAAEGAASGGSAEVAAQQTGADAQGDGQATAGAAAEATADEAKAGSAAEGGAEAEGEQVAKRADGFPEKVPIGDREYPIDEVLSNPELRSKLVASLLQTKSQTRAAQKHKEAADAAEKDKATLADELKVLQDKLAAMEQGRQGTQDKAAETGPRPLTAESLRPVRDHYAPVVRDVAGGRMGEQWAGLAQEAPDVVADILSFRDLTVSREAYLEEKLAKLEERLGTYDTASEQAQRGALRQYAERTMTTGLEKLAAKSEYSDVLSHPQVREEFQAFLRDTEVGPGKLDIRNVENEDWLEAQYIAFLRIVHPDVYRVVMSTRVVGQPVSADRHLAAGEGTGKGGVRQLSDVEQLDRELSGL